MKRKKRERAERLHRDAIVRAIARILATGRPTKWRWESACRRGIRAALCLQGWQWAAADDRAARVVNLALHRIDAGIRPAWRVTAPDERQRVGDAEYQFCRRCKGRQEAGSSSPWCSHECWAGEREALRSGQARRDDEIAAAARAAIFGTGVARHLPRGNRCRQCSKLFTPTGSRQQPYCSYRCFRVAGPRVPMKDCLVCASPFRGGSNARLYCGPACVAEGGRRKMMARRAANDTGRADLVA